MKGNQITGYFDFINDVGHGEEASAAKINESVGYYVVFHLESSKSLQKKLSKPKAKTSPSMIFHLSINGMNAVFMSD